MNTKLKEAESSESNLPDKLTWKYLVFYEFDMVVLVWFLVIMTTIHVFMPTDAMISRLIDMGFGALVAMFRRNHGLTGGKG